MNTKTIARKAGSSTINKDPVRLTALWYLRDALIQERYEDCREIISIAYEFGATENDVQSLLEDSRRRPS